MTSDDKQKILQLHQQGKGYGAIAAELGLSVNTVKSFCRRNRIQEATKEAKIACCLQCGKPVRQHAKRKEKKFCSDACRLKWWNTHRDKVQHSVVRELECPVCHASFKTYGTASRKYCSHACYIKYRFGGKV